MGFADAVKTVLGKYADFSGRARRSEYWWWYLALVIYYIVLIVLLSTGKSIGAILFGLGLLAVILPTLAVGVRRLHDTGKSGWWMLIGLVPFGGIVLLVFFVMDSTPGPNSYGPSPKDGGFGAPPPGYAAPTA